MIINFCRRRFGEKWLKILEHFKTLFILAKIQLNWLEQKIKKSTMTALKSSNRKEFNKNT